MRVRLTGETQTEVEVEAGSPLAAVHPPAGGKHTCGGHGRCGACIVAIQAGMENLAPPSEAESRALRILKAGPSQRLACQAKVNGEVACRY